MTPRPKQQLPKGVTVEDFMATRHEVVEQFPPPEGKKPKVGPRKVQQLPEGVKAEDYIHGMGEKE